MGDPLIRLGFDWAGVVDAAQRDVRDDQEWIDGIIQKLAGVTRMQSAASMSIVEHDETCSSARYRAFGMPSGVSTTAGIERDAGAQMLGVEGFRAFYYPARVVTTHYEIEEDLKAQARSLPVEAMESFRREIAVKDVFGAFAYPEPGIVISIYAMHDRRIVLSRYERTVLTRLMLHLESSYRVRKRPETIVATLDADGRVLERSTDAPPDGLMSAYVAQRHAASPQLLWPALLAGRLSVVPRGVGRRRRYLLLENAPRSQPFRALTEGEVAVLSQAAHGHSTKMISFALGVTPSVVSSRLTAATSKLGIASRVELVRLAAMLSRDPRAGFENVDLTNAERDVLELLERGLSNTEIARMRSRSVRTIANQVASLLRKTRTGSRRALLARR